MEYIAISKSVRVSPRKVRLVADAIRVLSIKRALSQLEVAGKIAALPLEKTLRSALANAKDRSKLDMDGLVIKAIDVAEGPVLKRYHPSTRGRIHPYKKRSSHIKVVLSDDQNQNSKIKDQKSIRKGEKDGTES